ncbi:MAG: hypothetical protein Q9210_003498 [Variospora velana]
MDALSALTSMVQSLKLTTSMVQSLKLTILTTLEIHDQHYERQNANLEDSKSRISTQTGLVTYTGSITHDSKLQFARSLCDGAYLDAAVKSTSGCSITPALNTTKSRLSKWKRGLSGFVNGKRISALPDTGSLRNVMSEAFAQEMNLKIQNSPSSFTLGNNKLIKSIGWHKPYRKFQILRPIVADRVISSFALAHGLRVRKGPAHRNTVQFADGTYQETVGQVETYWTFESGQRIPVTFEVLENCCSDVILGESILYDHNVFEDHTSSLVATDSDSDTYPLAPFDFANRWQRSWPRIKERFKLGTNSGQGASTTSASGIEEMRWEEARRQEEWNYQYSFGDMASEAEKAAEAQKRASFKSQLRATLQAPPASDPRQANAYQVPSIPTAPNRSRPQRP